MRNTTNSATKISILDGKDELIVNKEITHLTHEASKDNIFVDVKRFDGVLHYKVIKTWYSTFEGALAAVKFEQSLLAPSCEVRP